MKAEEKALELIAAFITETLGKPTLTNKQAKACALICVDEILNIADPELVGYFNEVKSFIEKS